jgi:hypothetical protein
MIGLRKIMSEAYIGIRRQLIVNFKLKLLIFIELHQIISYK